MSSSLTKTLTQPWLQLSELPGGARGDALDDGGARGIRSLAHDGRGRRARQVRLGRAHAQPASGLRPPGLRPQASGTRPRLSSASARVISGAPCRDRRTARQGAPRWAGPPRPAGQPRAESGPGGSVPRAPPLHTLPFVRAQTEKKQPRRARRGGDRAAQSSGQRACHSNQSVL